MNEIITKFLLAEDKFMLEMHLRQPWFTYSACGTCTKSKDRTKTVKEKRDSKYIYQSKLDKGCFQHDFNTDLLQWVFNFLVKNNLIQKRNTN